MFIIDGMSAESISLSIEVDTGVCSIGLCLDAGSVCWIHISGDGDWAWGQLWGSNNFICVCGNHSFHPRSLNTQYSNHHCHYYEKNSK